MKVTMGMLNEINYFFEKYEDLDLCRHILNITTDAKVIKKLKNIEKSIDDKKDFKKFIWLLRRHSGLTFKVTFGVRNYEIKSNEDIIDMFLDAVYHENFEDNIKKFLKVAENFTTDRYFEHAINMMIGNDFDRLRDSGEFWYDMHHLSVGPNIPYYKIAHSIEKANLKGVNNEVFETLLKHLSEKDNDDWVFIDAFLRHLKDFRIELAKDTSLPLTDKYVLKRFIELICVQHKNWFLSVAEVLLDFNMVGINQELKSKILNMTDYQSENDMFNYPSQYEVDIVEGICQISHLLSYSTKSEQEMLLNSMISKNITTVQGLYQLLITDFKDMIQRFTEKKTNLVYLPVNFVELNEKLDKNQKDSLFCKQNISLLLSPELDVDFVEQLIHFIENKPTKFKFSDLLYIFNGVLPMGEEYVERNFTENSISNFKVNYV